MEEVSRRGGITISREVRAGELLQLVGFLAAGFLAWGAMDTRVTKVEERQMAQAVQFQETRVELRDNIREIRNDQKDITTGLRSLDQRISRKGL